MYTYCYSYYSFVRINFLETEIRYIVTSETQSYHGNRIPYSGFFKKETFTNFTNQLTYVKSLTSKYFLKHLSK